MKSFKLISVLLFLIILSGLLSCSKSSNPLFTPTEFTIDNFPHEIGTVWQYQRRIDDFRSFTIDTLFVRIVDTAIITDDSLKVFVVVADLATVMADSSDTTYWYIAGDTVTYYTKESDLYRVTRNVVFPLEVGSNWSSGVFPPDSNEVTEMTQVTILGRNYQNAYQIVRNASGLNEYYLDSFLYVPNIGLIESSENHILWTTTKDETWKLIPYYEPDSLELSDFPLQVNASWTYNVVNNLLDCVNCFDTVTVTIMDSILDRGGVINQNWLLDYPGQEKVIINRLDKNKLFLQWHHYAVSFSLEFPLTIGKQWDDVGLISSSLQVKDRQTVTTPAGIFKDAYYLKGFSNDGFEPGAKFEIWIAKGYGIVKLNHNGAPMGYFEDKSWELKSYDPNKPAESFTIDKFPSLDGMSWNY